MKRTTSLFLAIVIALGTMACTSSGNIETNPKVDSETSGSLSFPDIEGDYEDRSKEDNEIISVRIRSVSSDEFIMDYYYDDVYVAVTPLTGIACKIYTNGEDDGSIMFLSDKLCVDNFDRSLFESNIGEEFDSDDTPDSYIESLLERLKSGKTWFEGSINLADHTITIILIEEEYGSPVCLAHKVDSANSLPTQYSGPSIPEQESHSKQEEEYVSDDDTSEELLSEVGTEGLLYKANSEGTYSVTGYEGTEVNIVIPDTYNDIPVTNILQDVFATSDIQSIQIGKNVSSIGFRSFAQATLLRTVTIKSDNIHIGDYAFSGCISLDNLMFTQDNYTVQIRGNPLWCHCFNGCKALTSLDFSKANEFSEVEITAFASCDNLREIYVPSDSNIFVKPDLKNVTNYGKISSVNGVLTDCDAEIIYE